MTEIETVYKIDSVIPENFRAEAKEYLAKRTAPFLANNEDIEKDFLEVQIIPELVQLLRLDLRPIEATAPRYQPGMKLMRYFKQILRAYRMKQRCQEEYVTNVTMLNALEAMIGRLRSDRATHVVVALAKQKSMRGPLMGIHDYTLTCMGEAGSYIRRH